MSATAQEFISLLDALEHTKAAIAELVTRQNGDYRHGVIKLRRKLSQQLAELGTAGEQFFADTPALATFRSKFSRLRVTTAAHQAAWSAVLLGERPDEFRASTEPMRSASTEFLQWAREAVRSQT